MTKNFMKKEFFGKIMRFYDNYIIKVVTGIKRCSKAYFLLSVICILTSLFIMSITVNADVSISNYNTPDRNMAVGSWKNLYGQLYSSAGYDYVYAGVHYPNGNKVSGVWDTHSVKTWSTGYNISSLDNDIHLSYLPQGKYYYMIEVRDMNGSYYQPIGQYWFNVGAVKPGKPTLKVTKGNYPNKTTFSWTTSSAATQYDLFVDGTCVYSGSGTSYSYAVPAGSHSAHVNAVNGNFYDCSTSSGGTSFTIVKQTYTVSYNANGGSGAPSYQTKTYGTNLTLSSNKPSRTGYTFSHWKSSYNGSTYYPGGQYGYEANTTMTAQWKANTYTVKYNGNGATSGSTPSSTHTYDTAKSLTANGFSRTGYTFLGWSTGSSATSATYSNKQSVTNITSTNGATVNLYAVWKANTYSIAYNANGGSGSMSNTTHTYGKSQTLPTNKFSRTGYTFLGWSTDKNATSAKYTERQAVSNLTSTAGGTVTLYAIWKANVYSIKYNGNGATSGSMSNSSHTYNVNQKLTTNAYKRDGYEFLGWSTDSSSSAAKYTNNQSVVNLSSTSGATVNLYAVWKKIPETAGVEFSETSYHSGKKLTLVSATSGATIYYTTDGTEPTKSSKVYSEPLDFNKAGTTTIKAYAVADGYVPSAIYNHSISVSAVAQPEISVSEEWVGGATVKITSETPSASIYYTVDGTDPLTSSTAKLYSEEFEVDASMIVSELEKVIILSAAKKNGYAVSSQAKVLVQIKDKEIFAPQEVEIQHAQITKSGIAADIINENADDVIGEIFIVTYDKDTKKMKNVVMEEIKVPAGDMLPYSTDIKIEPNHAVKILIWEKESIKPLCVAMGIE